MKLVTYSHQHAPRLGAVLDEHVVDLNRAHAAMLRSTGDDCVSDALIDALVPIDTIGLLRGGRRSWEAARAALDWAADHLGRDRAAADAFGAPLATGLDEVTLHAPVRRPRKILCVGLNYRDHAEEQGARMPANPILFAKYDAVPTGHQQPVASPATTEKLDYEAELAVVIGRGGRHIAEAEALDHVAGYTAFNDVTCRDLQFADRQWLRGKMGDTHAPMGPWLVTPDELGDPGSLDISLTLNGEVMQSSNTEQLIFDVPHLIHFISRTVTLEPGDVIATGTPGGVGFAREPAVFLRPDDVVQVEIDHIGTLENRIVAEG